MFWDMIFVAQKAGKFADEIIPIKVKGKKGK